MTNPWDTNAVPPLTTPPTFHVKTGCQGGRNSAALGGAMNRVCCHAHPSTLTGHLSSLSLHHALKATKRTQTKWGEIKTGCVASFLNFTEKLHKCVLFFAFQVPDVKSTQSDGTVSVDKGWFCHHSSLTKFLQHVLKNHLHQLAHEFGHGSPSNKKPLQEVVKQQSYVMDLWFRRAALADAGIGESSTVQREVIQGLCKSLINDEALPCCNGHGHEGWRKWRWWEEKGGSGDAAHDFRLSNWKATLITYWWKVIDLILSSTILGEMELEAKEFTICRVLIHIHKVNPRKIISNIILYFTILSYFYFQIEYERDTEKLFLSQEPARVPILALPPNSFVVLDKLLNCSVLISPPQRIMNPTQYYEA